MVKDDYYLRDWRWAYDKKYKGVDEGKDRSVEAYGFKEFGDPFKAYWSEEHSVGILERDDKFIGVACLVAKEVTDKESFVRKFGLSFSWYVSFVLSSLV